MKFRPRSFHRNQRIYPGPTRDTTRSSGNAHQRRLKRRSATSKKSEWLKTVRKGE